MTNKIQEFVLNTHLFPTVNDNGQLVSNTKLGWQSSRVTDSTQKNIKDTMTMISAWVADGTLKDGDIITSHSQINFTASAEPMVTTGLTINGKEVELPEAAADESDVPF